MRPPWVRGVVLLAGLVLAVGACRGDGPRTDVPAAPGSAGGPVTFVVLGDGRAAGSRIEDPLRDSWSQLVFRDALPVRSVYVNEGGAGASVADVRDDQVPRALDLRPSIAAIWVGAEDERRGIGPDTYRARLEAAVQDLQAPGPVQVLLLGSGPYADAARQVADATGSTLVDLTGIGLANPDAAQPEIAAAVGQALGPVR